MDVSSPLSLRCPAPRQRTAPLARVAVVPCGRPRDGGPTPTARQQPIRMSPAPLPLAFLTPCPAGQLETADAQQPWTKHTHEHSRGAPVTAATSPPSAPLGDGGGRPDPVIWGGGFGRVHALGQQVGPPGRGLGQLGDRRGLLLGGEPGLECRAAAPAICAYRSRAGSGLVIPVGSSLCSTAGKMAVPPLARSPMPRGRSRL